MTGRLVFEAPRQGTDRDNTQHNDQVACLVVLGMLLEYRGPVSGGPTSQRREAAISRPSRTCCTALADLRAHHHPAGAGCREVPLDREAGFTPSVEKKQIFVKPKHGVFG